MRYPYDLSTLTVSQYFHIIYWTESKFISTPGRCSAAQQFYIWIVPEEAVAERFGIVNISSNKIAPAAATTTTIAAAMHQLWQEAMEKKNRASHTILTEDSYPLDRKIIYYFNVIGKKMDGQQISSGWSTQTKKGTLQKSKRTCMEQWIATKNRANNNN